MIIAYKKIRTRARYLIRQQICYIAEKEILPTLWLGLTHYEPLFIYTPKNGTTVYYDFTSPDQDPTTGCIYLEKNPERFWEIVKGFDSDLKELKEFISKKAKEQFMLIFKKLILFWSKLAIFVAIGGTRKNLVNEKLSQTAYELRAETDKIIYEAVDLILEGIKDQLPEDYRKYKDLLLLEEITGKLPEIKLLEERAEGYIFFKGQIYSNIKTKDFLTKNNLRLITDEKNILKGEPINKGIIEGIAKIVFEDSELSKLESGDILVSPMTNPNFLPYLEKIKGIITDEGGITCHAAILAREFNIPTIIGTGYASRMIKDGDLIELNANEGTVSILN